MHTLSPVVERIFMQIFINHKNGVPAWRQIVNQVKNLLAAGALEVGDKLPSVRSLAVDLGVNPITTARAYRELEAEGVTETRKGAGTFVAKIRVQLAEKEILRRLTPNVDELLVTSRQMGMSFKELLDLVKARNSSVFKDPENK